MYRTINRKFLVAFFTLISCSLFGQIDSVGVDVHFKEGVSPGDSALSTNVLQVDASIYSVNSMADVTTTIYDLEMQVPLASLTRTRQEFSDAGHISGNTISTFFYGLNPATRYRIETNVRNLQGGYFSTVITNYNP